jgi:tetratricopeptide (TPR) repeat protein
VPSESTSPGLPYQDGSVKHLVELGYVDPDVVAAREAALHRQLEAELQKATQLLGHGEIAQAQRLFETLTIDDPNWIAPRQLLAETYYRGGLFAESQWQLDWLAEHAVEHPRLSLISGALALARRDLHAALEELEYAAYVEPELASVHTLLGLVLLRLARLEDAEVALQAAVKQRPSDAVTYDGLAQIYIRLGQFEEAAGMALEALEHDMHLFNAHYDLGVALLRLGRPHEAITAFETATRTDPNRAAPYYWMSRIAAEQIGDQLRANSYRDAGREIIRRRRDRRGS